MTLKEKLIVSTASITMVLCVLFGITWITNGLGYSTFDLSTLLKGIEALKGVLSVVGGMQ